MQNAVTETQSKNFERFQILGGLAYVMVCIQLKDFTEFHGISGNL